MSELSSHDDDATRQDAFRLIGAGYLVPVALYTAYALWRFPAGWAWGLVIFGVLFSLLAGAGLLMLLRQWEYRLRTTVDYLVEQRSHAQAPATTEATTAPADPMLQQAIDSAEKKMNTQSEELAAREKLITRLTAEINQLKQESHDLDEKVKNSSQQMHSRESVITDYQQTISEQRAIIDKKQQYISKLEAKVQDLTYEVKTLLQLGELGANLERPSMEQSADTTHPVLEVFGQQQHESPEVEEMAHALPVSSDRAVHSHYDAAVQLQKCVDVAKKLTGASHLGGEQSRFLGVSVDSYAIDLRRLFDSFRNEHACTILLYTPKDQQLIFVNNEIKGLLGWSPDKFIKDFPQLIQSTIPDWRHALSQVQKQGETQVRLLAKHREGEELPVHCYLGRIPTGAFADHVIGILYRD